ncbi:tRNA (guanosine(37)-N1)-methyltransferase TrmD [Mailhella massiliensis]|uniref:tRNA (guanosine(37)-N1)-methyltransferase TrmD n=1 Tax=Mailhella massiliensis TaxID=1903261 RepID=UPI00097DAE60|nr:tRNA (guanosine(37)-N1)-methyltransferase TrmD [Mailhella massiliensis]
MRYHLVTLFPEWFDSPLSSGLMEKAREAGIVEFTFSNPRDKSTDRHHSVDDRPYGGGPGMVLMLDPLVRTLRELPPCNGRKGRLIALTPAGRPFTQALARELAKEEELTLVCGRYEGFDARLFDLLPVEPVCVGEAVLNGGEAAALAVIEATARLQPGFMGKDESGDEESFSNGLLEYPQYTRPENFEGLEVPAVLQGGNHAHIAAWRREQSVLATAKHRPDLLDHAVLTHHDREILRAAPRFRPAKNLSVALLHHPVRLKDRKTGTTSLTNLDIHDIARISRTYGISGFFVVTPLKDQLRLLATLLSHWTEGPGLSFNADRAEALRLVRPEESLESAIATLTTDRGLPPFVVGTSAQPLLDKKHRERRPASTFDEVRDRLADRPVLLLLGTGHGIAPEVLEQCDAVLPPLRWMDEYNHLPVRAAAAILLDRLLGDRG